MSGRAHARDTLIWDYAALADTTSALDLSTGERCRLLVRPACAVVLMPSGTPTSALDLSTGDAAVTRTGVRRFRVSVLSPRPLFVPSLKTACAAIELAC
jgi:hypothetical protein